MKKHIVLLPGDGIGKEVMESAKAVLNTIAEEFNHSFSFESHDIGGAAIDRHGNPLPPETTAACKKADAVLLGAVGGPKWDANPSHLRPERGLLGIRKELGLFANLRPIKGFEKLLHSSPLKEEVVKGSDLLIVRELTGGLYFGTPSERRDNGQVVVDTLFYTRSEIERIVDKAFQCAQQRRGHLTSVDKANVLESSKLWREVVEKKKQQYPDVTVEHVLVDAAAMKLITNPSQFDVIVTENMFGDILSDEASVLTGSLGMLPSASLREDGFGLYEPVHGSAPDIAGKGVANPVAMILSAAMMLRHSFQLTVEADVIEDTVESILNAGFHTADLKNAGKKVGTEEMTSLIIGSIKTRSAANCIMSCYA
ncbi:3-isopropylmalate dehydrogenase [Neobacillus notoginsengisoli]|uniref:3-isopropylmalate dehydrogenase n=1 Tax=Neobacillus notoginsengisoli TaxID=1578198 RepID=A0A417YWF9_9BACI|nr:3-isopropylmalate dehydrogenase [Neobacillus notoginsengisoli]RHW41676.1 3-isopropylmalate dehydrogenase [Neobacillus notoginsengisoli]